MKPMHSSLIRLSRCPCCQSKHSKHHSARKNNGKSAARQRAKRELRKEIDR